MLEEAVRWVIITIIFVFDPLAVLLLIASQYTFEWRRKDDSGGWLRQYEQARAQRIVDNPGYNPEPPAAPKEEKEEIDDTESNTATDDVLGDVVPEDDTADTNVSDTTVEQPEIQDDVEDDNRERLEEDSKKKDIASSEELKTRQEKIKILDSDPVWQEAKRNWKSENPNLSLKLFKDLYLQGKIDSLPWETEQYLNSSSTNDTTQQGYIQNQEQSDNSIWKKIQDSKEK